VSSLGRPRLHLRETDSTNERAKQLALAGAPHGTLVTAGAQTAGRGRFGRPWVAPPGRSVLASLVLRGLDERAAVLPLVAAVATCEACERCAPVACTIKWPNDVWIEDRKVAGILLEGRPQEGWAVLGIGINVATRAEELPRELHHTATSLALASGRDVGHDTDRPEVVLAALLETLEGALSVDPHDIVARWRTRDALLDRAVRWEGGEGLARGIDESGALIVASDRGEQRLQSGEVSVVRPAAG
jgi:BirA family biotin operon repressor/biotin-[acetyl-CoA-carboxylase] ligase